MHKYILILSPISLFGYLDPGSGSILVYFTIGLFATLIYSIKNLIFKIKNTFLKIFSKHKINLKEKKNIVFYSEGNHYYEVFRPVIEKLTEMETYCSYYTSDKQDKGLEYKNEYCDSVFIGESKFAIMSLNYLNAKILVMTTPQLDVMYLKKSKDVDYFVHLVHAPTDVFNYKPFAFDFFDCVMCSGQHQIDNIKLIEKARKLPAKELLQTGLTYFDALLKNKKTIKNTQTTILVSPTWGEFGLLNRWGFEILEILANANFKVICRPHPQSFVNDIDLIENIIKQSKSFKKIEIDTKPSPNSSMSVADIMISDISGIIFDFAFIYEKPIIVFNNMVSDDSFSELNEVKKYFDIDKKIWELDNMDKVAMVIDPKNLLELEETINKTLKNSSTSSISDFRDEALFNYGYAGDVCAKQLADMLQRHIK